LTKHIKQNLKEVRQMSIYPAADI